MFRTYESPHYRQPGAVGPVSGGGNGGAGNYSNPGPLFGLEPATAATSRPFAPPRGPPLPMPHQHSAPAPLLSASSSSSASYPPPPGPYGSGAGSSGPSFIPQNKHSFVPLLAPGAGPGRPLLSQSSSASASASAAAPPSAARFGGSHNPNPSRSSEMSDVASNDGSTAAGSTAPYAHKLLRYKAKRFLYLLFVLLFTAVVCLFLYNKATRESSSVSCVISSKRRTALTAKP
jgi:hypothetical protein